MFSRQSPSFERLAYNAFRTIIGLCFIINFCLFGFIFSLVTTPVYAQNTPSEAQMELRLRVNPATVLIPPPLKLEEKENDEFIFTLGPIRLADGTLLRNERAQLYILLEGEANYLILEGYINSESLFILDTSQSLSSQNIQIIRGSNELYERINSSVRIVESFGVARYLNQQQESNRVNYNPPPPPQEPQQPQQPTQPTQVAPPRTGGNNLIISIGLVIFILLIIIIIYLRTRRRKIIQPIIKPKNQLQSTEIKTLSKNSGMKKKTKK